MSTYSPATIKYLRDQLAQLNSWRVNEECNLAGAESRVRGIQTTIAEVTGRIADMEKLLAIVAPQPNTIRDFSVGDLVNVCDQGHKHFGTRGKVIDFAYDPDEVVVEYDNLGSSLYLAPAQLMQHTEFVKQSDEVFEAAEQQAAKDAEAADDAMSASERHEHDQADEFAQDAADAERWTEENAANQYDDAHYNTDDENQDDEDGEL